MKLHRRNAHSPAGQRAASHSRRGFTLVELIVGASVSLLVVAAALALYLFNYKIGFVSQERNKINSDIRDFTGQLILDGRQANYFVLYESTRSDARDSAGDRRLNGTSGDFLVFVETEPTGNIVNPSLITKITAYYRAVESSDPDALAPVRRLEMEFNPGSSEPLEELLPNTSELILADEVVELSRGLANGRLFFNFWGRSIMVNGQIHHGNEAKRITETYNFTISPRG